MRLRIGLAHKCDGELDVPDENYWREVLTGSKKGLGYTLLRCLLFLLELAYEGGLAVYLALERIGLRRRFVLPVPVISVGNLSVGGTGKTPVTQWLARRLQQEAFKPTVLNRGHGGAISPMVAIVSDGSLPPRLNAADSGDEANLLANSLPGIPVVIGKDRRESGRVAVSQLGANVLVLDDGFQYWQLARNIDIVLLDALAPFDNGHALPRGFLREPKENLSRADVVLVTRSDRIADSERVELRRQIAELAPTASTFFATHQPKAIDAWNPIAADHKPLRLLPVCGIAQPLSFTATLEKIVTCAMAETLAFPDHQPFGDEQRAIIEKRAEEVNADAVITTEKDAVKFPPDYLAIPVYTLKIEIAIEEEELFWETVKLRAGLAGIGND